MLLRCLTLSNHCRIDCAHCSHHKREELPSPNDLSFSVATSRTPRAAKEEPILSNFVKRWGTSYQSLHFVFVAASCLHVGKNNHCHMPCAVCSLSGTLSTGAQIRTPMTIISYNLKDLKPHLFQTINRKLITKNWINSACFVS